MNAALVKETTDKKYAKKYMERHQTLCVTLSKETDADIIAWLEKQPNRSRAVRAVLRRAATLQHKEKST